MKINRTVRLLVLFGLLPCAIAFSNALAEKTLKSNTVDLTDVDIDSKLINNKKYINPEGNLLLSFEAKPTFVHPVSLVQLKGAESLSDLMRAYPADYIEEYREVRLSAQGKTCFGKDEQLNKDQKLLIQALTASDKFKLEIDFISKNALTHRLEDKTMYFEITVEPSRSAAYAEGENGMNTYFRDASLSKAESISFKELVGMKVVFTINEEGKVENPRLQECSSYKELTDFLIKTTEDMPAWIPALNEKGEKISQDFYLDIIAFDFC